MTHPYVESQLDAYLDGELSAADTRELESHLGQCPACTRFLDRRLALRSAIKARIPSLRAPDVLRQRVRKLSTPSRAAGRAPVLWRSLAIAASIAVIAFGGWQLGYQRGVGEMLANQVLASHVRSLMPGHLMDVQSTDQHTVKPWFNGKLDFSPPVHDFADRGYPLVGGRLDYVGSRPVGALVYGRRQHVINVFLWPYSRDAARGPTSLTRNGYHVLHWSTPQYTYWVASDLGLPELQEFAQLLKQSSD